MDRAARIKALQQDMLQDAHTIGQQCAKQFGHIKFDLPYFYIDESACPENCDIDDIHCLIHAFLEGLGASPFLRSIKLQSYAASDAENQAMIRLQKGLESRTQARAPHLFFSDKGCPDGERLEGYRETLVGVFSSPTLAPYAITLRLPENAEPVMTALARADDLQLLKLSFACGNVSDSLPLKGYEECWPHLRELKLRSEGGEMPMHAMDWAAFMKSHPQLQDIVLHAVQAPLAKLLRRKLTFCSDLQPGTMEGLADALAATNSLRQLTLKSPTLADASELLRGLAGNKSLYDLSLDITPNNRLPLQGSAQSDDKPRTDSKAWAEVIRGLKDHPCLTTMTVYYEYGDEEIEAACKALQEAKPELYLCLY